MHIILEQCILYFYPFGLDPNKEVLVKYVNTVRSFFVMNSLSTISIT